MKIITYTKFFNRLFGLAFIKEKIDYGICFPKCNSIHTFFMKQEIDVVMTDINNNVLYMYDNLKPNKIILPKKNVYYTYELPAGSIKKTKIYNKFPN